MFRVQCLWRSISPIATRAWVRHSTSHIKKPFTFDEAAKWINQFSKDSIPKEHVSVSFSRSSGPGGQNVNKVSTKVDLRLHLNEATWIPSYARDALIAKPSPHRVTQAGDLVITSDRTRSQSKNLNDCYDKLVDAIVHAVSVPREPDAQTRARVAEYRRQEDARRKEMKKRHSKKKSDRRSHGRDY